MNGALMRMGLTIALIAAVFFGEQYIEGLGAAKANLACSVKIDAANRAADDKLQALTAQAAEATRKLQAQADAQNIKDSEHATTETALTGHIHTLAGLYAGRLRDPNATANSCSAGPPSGATGTAHTGDGNTAQTDGLFSVPFTDLLTTIVRDADRINDAYASCRSRIVKVTDQQVTGDNPGK